jgi:hypothetical protein
MFLLSIFERPNRQLPAGNPVVLVQLVITGETAAITTIRPANYWLKSPNERFKR